VSPQEFIDAVSTAAKSSAAATKIPASFTVAEAALESGWGAHAPGMNLFGVKADPAWHGPVTIQRTREFLNGAWTFVDAKFRSYSDWLGSIEDHAQFLLTNPRYRPAFAYTSGVTFAQAIAAAGYATDPAYASKIIAIIKAYGLISLDAMSTSASPH
jgi:flagellum-specific peptidoglycan hydrolase FlgJ